MSVEGFRGVNKPVRLEFGPKATVLSALNGRGKSTLLGAIEWGLFGELKFQPPENRTRDELVSLFHPGGKASVQLVLSANSAEVRIRRTKSVGKMGSSVEVSNGGPRPLEAEEAEAYLFRLTGLDFRDFYRAAFLHQDSIRGLLTEEQKDRDEALDRLLGVETIRNILTAIRLNPVIDAIEEIENSERRIMDRLSGAGGMAETTRKRALDEAVEFGYGEEDLTLATGQKESKLLQSDLGEVCTTFGGEKQDPISAETPEDIERLARRIKSVTKDIRYSAGKETPLDSAISQLGTLKKLKGELESANEALRVAKEELQNHIESVGTADEWRTREREAAGIAETTEMALHILDAHGRVVEDALAYFEAEPKAKECPVCGDAKEASRLVARLKSVVQKDQATEIRRLNKLKESAEESLSELEDLRKARDKLEKALESAGKELESEVGRAWQALGAKAGKGDPLVVIEAQENEINGRLEGLRNLNKEREEVLQKLDDGADRVRALLRFLKAEADAKRVRENAEESEGGGAKAFEDDKRRLEALKVDLESIVQALNGLATARAETALAKSGPDISRIYGRLCNHPYFDGLKIEVGQKAVSGVQRNTYRIIAFSTKEGEKTSASSRLSTAQMNCVALSVYLSLAQVLSHNIGFIMLDDPSQNLDADHKSALASVLKDLLPSSQLVVGTHDAEFDGYLKTVFGNQGVSWYDLRWAPKDGTTLKPAM